MSIGDSNLHELCHNLWRATSMFGSEQLSWPRVALFSSFSAEIDYWDISLAFSSQPNGFWKLHWGSVKTFALFQSCDILIESSGILWITVSPGRGLVQWEMTLRLTLLSLYSWLFLWVIGTNWWSYKFHQTVNGHSLKRMTSKSCCKISLDLEHNGMEWNGVERSGVEQSRAEQKRIE